MLNNEKLRPVAKLHYTVWIDGILIVTNLLGQVRILMRSSTHNTTVVESDHSLSYHPVCEGL